MKTIRPDTRLPSPLRAAEQPALWVVDDFLDDDAIQEVLAVFGDEAFLEAEADHFGWDTCGFVAEIPSDRHPALARVAQRIEDATGIRSSLVATLRFRYYNEGQGHPPHVDAYTFEDTRLAVSTLITLVEPEAGGETRFLAAVPEPVAVAQRKGRLVAWTSVLAGGADDPASLHDGAAVAGGAKGVLLGFVYLPVAEMAQGVALTVGRQA